MLRKDLSNVLKCGKVKSLFFDKDLFCKDLLFEFDLGLGDGEEFFEICFFGIDEDIFYLFYFR